MPASGPTPNTTHRCVREDFRSLASYLDVALETLEDGAAPSADAITILRRARWHLAATPSRLDEIAALAADQSAFIAPRRAVMLTKPRMALGAVARENLLRQAALELASLGIDELLPLSGGRSKLTHYYMANVFAEATARIPRLCVMAEGHVQMNSDEIWVLRRGFSSWRKLTRNTKEMRQNGFPICVIVPRRTACARSRGTGPRQKPNQLQTVAGTG
jgi:hypothetical protein